MFVKTETRMFKKWLGDVPGWPVHPFCRILKTLVILSPFLARNSVQSSKCNGILVVFSW